MTKRDMLLIALIAGGTGALLSTGITLLVLGAPSEWIGFVGSIAGAIIGGGFTIGAAMVAVRPVVEQLTQIKRQTAASGKVALATLPAEMAQELDAIEAIYPIVNAISLDHWKWTHERYPDYHKLRDNMHGYIEDIMSRREALMTFEGRYDDEHPTTKSRRAVMRDLIDMQKQAGRLAQYIDAIVSPDDEKPILTSEEAKALDEQMLRAYERVHIALVAHRHSIGKVMADTWKTIRRLEMEAAGVL